MEVNDDLSLFSIGMSGRVTTPHLPAVGVKKNAHDHGGEQRKTILPVAGSPDAHIVLVAAEKHADVSVVRAEDADDKSGFRF